jgi:hypothetical protein
VRVVTVTGNCISSLSLINTKSILQDHLDLYSTKRAGVPKSNPCPKLARIECSALCTPEQTLENAFPPDVREISYSITNQWVLREGDMSMDDVHEWIGSGDYGDVYKFKHNVRLPFQADSRS